MAGNFPARHWDTPTGTPLQYSCLENPVDGGAWWAAVHGVARSWTRLSDFTFTFHFQALEKEMATHSSVLVWRIPGTGERGGLPSMGSHRVGHDWSDLAAAVAVGFYAHLCPSAPCCPEKDQKAVMAQIAKGPGVLSDRVVLYKSATKLKKKWMEEGTQGPPHPQPSCERITDFLCPEVSLNGICSITSNVCRNLEVITDTALSLLG